MNSSYLLKNVRIAGSSSPLQDIPVENGIWTSNQVADCQVVDCEGSWLIPGLVALDVDFQEPAHDEVYTLANGFEALRRGGFTHAIYESHANPLDDTYKLEAMRNACQKQVAQLHFLGAISPGHQSSSLSEMLELWKNGVVGFSDGGSMPQNLRFLRRAFEYASMTPARLHFLPLEKQLAGKGCVHEGHVADTLGMKGIPTQAESIAVNQLLELSRWLKVPVHLKQITSAESLQLIRQARERGVDVTCDVGIYHLLYCDQDLFSLDSHLHILPPLRSAEDREALWQGIVDGTITAISCAHHPVLPQDKEINFEDATPGAISLEIAFAAFMQAAEARQLPSLELALRLLRQGPAQVAGIALQDLEVHQPLKAFLYNPQKSRAVKGIFAGKVENSPLLPTNQQGSIWAEFTTGAMRQVP